MMDVDCKIVKKRVKVWCDFVSIVLVLVVVEIVLIVVWFVILGGYGYFWLLWLVLGFGIVIVFLVFNVFGILNCDVIDGDIDVEFEWMWCKG